MGLGLCKQTLLPTPFYTCKSRCQVSVEEILCLSFSLLFFCGLKIEVNQSSGTSSDHVSAIALLDMAELHTGFTELCPV